MTDLVVWLLKQVADDERLARDAGATRSGTPARWRVACDCDAQHDDDCCERRIEGDNITIYAEGGHDEDQARHIASWDPVRVLAECEMKRAIIALHGLEVQVNSASMVERGAAPEYRFCECQTEDGLIHGTWPCDTLKAIAAVFADRPGYEERVA